MNDILFQPLGNPIAASDGLGKSADIDPRLTRTHYFDGRLLTAEDLTRDQIYLDQRLREVGEVLGSGIMSGLQLSFDRYTGKLTLRPGVALTPAGRVLELGSQLVVNLGDRALISQLNDGYYRRFNRALYAVVLRYIEAKTDVAEVFPTDLGSRRGSEYALITECVQMGLVPLPVPLPQQSALQIRARLMREFIGNSQFTSLIPEDAVALGVLAIQDDTPQWLDAELLRHPIRAEVALGDHQADLSRQYETLLIDILSARRAGSLNGDFHASDYFSLIPPVGTLPKDAVDPTTGRQGYFPENYQVAIAPIRQSDVALIKSESLGLPPIDLSNSEPVDVVVLVPLSNLDYGQYAAQLERDYNPADRRLPQIDLLRLKLYPIRPVHKLNTDQSAWTNIWSCLGDDQPFYVRRPTRAAETAVSGVVLALGTTMPTRRTKRLAQTTTLAMSPADSGGLVQDESSVFLSRMNPNTLKELRPPVDDTGDKAFEKLAAKIGKDALMVQQCAGILMRVERRYDSVIWQTLLALAASKHLAEFLKGLVEADSKAATAEVVANLGTRLGLNANLLKQWSKLES
jgi:hypothetical protein